MLCCKTEGRLLLLFSTSEASVRSFLASAIGSFLFQLSGIQASVTMNGFIGIIVDLARLQRQQPGSKSNAVDVISEVIYRHWGFECTAQGRPCPA